MNSSAKEKWIQALDSEYTSLIKNRAWNLVKLPEGRKPVGCRWVFKVKHNAGGSIERLGCKARLVAKGCYQEEGIDYEETYSPVARYTSIRSVLAIANQLDLELHQVDVQTAFLNGELEEEIYMSQPEGYKEKGKENYVCKVNKNLSGLKQASTCWFKTMDTYLKENDYEQCQADSCLYVKRAGAEFIIIALYVDNILLACNSTKLLQNEKEALEKKFCMKDLGEVRYCIGIQIERNRAEKMLLHQSTYLKNLLQKYGMQNCRAVPTPQVSGSTLFANEGDPVDKQRCQALIGSLTYAVTATRPDIAQALGSVNQFSSNPSAEHWQSVKLFCIKATLDWGIQFDGSKEKEVQLNGFVDAD